jgi:hypothetical protein
MKTPAFLSRLQSTGLIIPLLIAIAQLTVHMIFHSQYGYFRDELYYIACSDHLALGYVDQPPLSLLILKMSRMILGDSLHAIRFLPALAGATVVFLTALMARKLGAGSFAQAFAALAAVAAHVLIGHGRYFSMNAFDVLFWAAAGYVVVTILTDDRPKFWIFFGAIAGLGLQNKYSMGFLCIGITLGLLLSPQRKQLASKWFWLGVLVAALIFLPHVLWQISNGLPSLEFMRNASQNKNVPLGVLDFFLGQVRDANVLNTPLWLLGIYFFFTHKERRYRALGWMFPIIFTIMVLNNAKVYYLSAIYPIYLAGGAVAFERFIRARNWNWLKPVYSTLLLVVAVAIAPFALPVLPVEQFIAYQKSLGLAPKAEERSALAELPQSYADQFGWREMVDTVATVYARLTPAEKTQCVIFVRNYGEAAAIDFFGGAYGLPKALCAHNSYWYWGPGEKTGNIAIIFGTSRNLQENYDDLRRAYESVEFVTTTHAKYAMPYETERMIFLCKGMRTTFQAIWGEERFFI